MSVSYEVHVHNDLGQRLAILAQTFVSIDAIRMVNTVGTLTLTLPYGVLDPAFLHEDYAILVWRSINGGPRILMHETFYFIQTWTHSSRDEQQMTVIECVDALDLLRRRRIAYYAGSAEAQKAAAPADDLMKAFVRENLASTASDYAGTTDRGIGASSLGVDPDLGLGASTTKAAAWRLLYDVLRELADTSRANGTWLAFDMVPVVGQGLVFRTFAGQRGIDRRSGSNAVILSESAGTLINVDVITDFSGFATHIYAGGPGEESARIVEVASNPLLVRTNIGRREDFTTAYQGTTSGYVANEAEAALTLRSPRRALTAEIQASTSLIFDRDIGFGDYVQAEGFDFIGTARLDGVHTVLDSSGRETIRVMLRAEGSGPGVEMVRQVLQNTVDLTKLPEVPL